MSPFGPTSQALDWLKSYLFEPGILGYYRKLTLQNWRKGFIRWEQLSPTIQKYILDHGIEGPRQGGQQGAG